MQRSLNTSTSNLAEGTERLSTGSQINRAADDAAGFELLVKEMESDLKA